MKRNIITGKWEPGKKLPTEPVLSADLGISRQTLRHALQLLINDGLLYRQQGRGTFVQQKRSNYQLSYLESFTEQMQAIGKKATSKVIELKTNLIPEGSLAEKLLLSDRERMLKIVRLRLADGQPMSLEEVYIDINLCPNLHKKDLENQSLYTILEKEYGLKIKYGDLSLEARQATTEQAKLLQIKTSGLLLYMQCLTALCKYWGISYRPVIGQSSGKQSDVGGANPWKNINLRGIMLASLPGFISMAIILALSKIPALSMLGEVFDIMIKALPVVLAVIAAKQVSNLDEVSIVAGVIAGVLSVDGGIIGGMMGGIGAGLLSHLLFIKCLQWRFPTTTVNIVAGGLSGLVSGLTVYYLIAPFALQAGELIKWLIEQAVAFSPIVAGLIAGLMIWPAIIGGVYHAAILPIVLLEMERTGNSFLGAVDMVGLVMVSAGITLANIVAPRDKGEAAVAIPGFLINMGFGTFVEAAYPFMFSNKVVFGGAILSAGVGGMLVGLFGIRGTAYVPSFMAPLLSNNIIGFIIAMAAGLICSFVITVAANKLVGNGQMKKVK
jgi:DNA-binding GntR family transcriptional regulator